jgi:hypothetical protein
MAQIVRLIRPLVVPHVSGLTDLQQVALCTAFSYLVITEGNLREMLCWAWGNARQYTTSSRRHWTINPGDGLSYIAAANAREGAERWIGVLFHDPKWLRAIDAAVNGTAPPDVLPLLSTLTNAATNRAFAPLGRMRPDFFYPMLGYAGWYAEEHDHDPIHRTQIGIARSRAFLGYYTRVVATILANTVPPDVIVRVPLGAPSQPCSNEDLAFIRTMGTSVSRANVTVARPLPRIVANANTALPGTQPGVPPTQALPPRDPEAVAEDENSFARLFTLYAQQEYMRQRYSQRAAGANLKFQPYLVAGFPSVIWDSMASKMHVVGYLQSYSHSGMVGAGGSASLSSRASLSYCRTFYEFLSDVRTDAGRFAGRVTAAPAELISEIREVVQDEAGAEAFYSKLLFGGRPSKSGAAFRWTEAMGYSNGMESQEIEITGDSVGVVERRLRTQESAAQATANEADTVGAENVHPNPASPAQSATARGVSSETQSTVRTNIDPNREYSPRDNIYADAFASYHVAMQLAARPACTLDEYIRFWHGGKSIGVLRANGQVGQERYDFAYTKENVPDVVAESNGPQGQTLRRGITTRATAMFYDHIYKLRVGPGTGPDHLTGPSPEERGFSDPPTIQPTATVRGVPADYPQTRADWDTR